MAGLDGGDEQSQVFGDGFWMDATKTGIHFVADVVDVTTAAGQHFPEHFAAGAIHPVGHDA